MRVLAAAAALCTVVAASEVVDLTDDAFDDYIKENDVTMVRRPPCRRRRCVLRTREGDSRPPLTQRCCPRALHLGRTTATG
jgi:hypothetical protein